MVLLMSINPGFKGEKFNEVIYEKARVVKQMITASGRKALYCVAGGIFVLWRRLLDASSRSIAKPGIL